MEINTVVMLATFLVAFLALVVKLVELGRK